MREFTVEAGRPDTFSDEMLSVLAENGAHRISINPQTFNDSVLRTIGRRHNSAQTIKAFEMAREAGFDFVARFKERKVLEFAIK